MQLRPHGTGSERALGAVGRGGILADLAGAVSGGMGVLESCGMGERGVGWVVRVQGLDGGSECGAETGGRGRNPGQGSECGAGVEAQGYRARIQGSGPQGAGPGSGSQGSGPGPRVRAVGPGLWLGGRVLIGGRAPGCMAMIRSRGAGLGSGVEVQG